MIEKLSLEAIKQMDASEVTDTFNKKREELKRFYEAQDEDSKKRIISLYYLPGRPQSSALKKVLAPKAVSCSEGWAARAVRSCKRINRMIDVVNGDVNEEDVDNAIKKRKSEKGRPELKFNHRKPDLKILENVPLSVDDPFVGVIGEEHTIMGRTKTGVLKEINDHAANGSRGKCMRLFRVKVEEIPIVPNWKIERQVQND